MEPRRARTPGGGGKRPLAGAPQRGSHGANAPPHRPVKPSRIEEGAEADLAEALEFYREESEVLAGRLYEEINRLIAEVCAAPRLYHVVAPPVRRHFSETFPYAVLYVEKPDHVLILAIAHFKRRPGYWRERLR